MMIVHLSKNDIQGGAARAAYRLHKGLQRLGHASSMVVESRTSDDPSVRLFAKPMNPASIIRRGLRQVCMAREFSKYSASRPPENGLFNEDRSSYSSTLVDQLPESDIINLHWVPGFVDYESFFANVLKATPVVWTLHDMNPFTGGCHYDLGCGNYLHHCRECPQLGSSDRKDLSFRVWERKRRIFSKVPVSRLRIVSPSTWLANQAKQSPLLSGVALSVIPNGLDLEEFAPRHQGHVRHLLGIPQDARVVLFVAETVSDRRKGFAHLVEALARCGRNFPNLLVVSLGQNRPEVSDRIPCVHVGPVNNDRFLSMVYSAADLFAICSLQDNLPNTVLEALACGVPVVGYAVGGIPDMVRNGVNGLTVPVSDVDALARAISELLNSSVRCKEMGANARRIAVVEYSLELQARRYSELYAALLQKTEEPCLRLCRVMDEEGL